jgi:hypothetical protein
VRFPRGTGEPVAALLRAVAYAVEWTRPESEAAGWTAREASPDGPVDASYALHAGVLTRRIDGLAAGGVASTGVLAGGEIHGLLDASGRRLVDAQGGWHVRRINVQGAEALRSDVRVQIGPGSLARDLSGATSRLLSLEERFGDWTALDAAQRDPAEEARRCEQLAASTSVDQALGLLRSTDPAATARGIAALRALLERRPEACAAVAKDVVSAGLRDRAARTELSLLLGVGNPAAQSAIADVVRAWKGSADGRSALAMLGQLNEPTNETLEFLRTTRADRSDPDTARTADLALGSAAGHLASDDPSQANAIAASLEDRLRGGSDPADVAETLAALGNTHSPRILDVVPAYLQSDDPEVRRMAATALGQSPDTGATSILEQLANDADARVRSAAARALARRNSG